MSRSSMTPFAVAVAAAAALVVPSAARAGSDASAAEADGPSCPRLFGDEEQHAMNLARRTEQVETLRRTPRGLELRHHVGRWQRPRAARVANLAIAEVQGEGADARARVEVRGALADLCGGSTFWVHAGDNLGATSRVIGVFDDGLLIEQKRELRFITAEGQTAPRVDMVWSSPYLLVATAETRESPSTSRGRQSAARSGGVQKSVGAASASAKPEPLKSIRSGSEDLGSKAREAARERRRASDSRRKK